MNAWTVLAKIVELFASLGAGAASNGCSYEPEVPSMLQKQSKPNTNLKNLFFMSHEEQVFD